MEPLKPNENNRDYEVNTWISSVIDYFLTLGIVILGFAVPAVHM
jgi:hypothetical protein